MGCGRSPICGIDVASAVVDLSQIDLRSSPAARPRFTPTRSASEEFSVSASLALRVGIQSTDREQGVVDLGKPAASALPLTKTRQSEY